MQRTLATYPLRFPIIRETRNHEGSVSEEELRPVGFSVELKRPRGRDMKVMDQFEGAPIAGSMALLERISNLSAEEVELLDADDLGELGNLLNKASVSGQATGDPA